MHLSISDDIHEGREFEFENSDSIASMKETYEINKRKKVGDKMNCAVCKKEVVKKSYQAKFCCIKCKDQYWNTVDETRRERAKLFN
jgi:hypothetical protein